MEIPLPIKEALHLYYLHCKQQAKYGWDKSADLDLIDTICTKEGWSYEASAGTFWFSKSQGEKKITIKVTEGTFIEGGIHKTLKKGEPFGLMSEIRESLKKTGREPLFINADTYAQSTDPSNSETNQDT